jgi:DNA-binding response OmpR family regulator
VTTLLLIDDDPEFGRALAEALGDEGISVLYASEAARGVELALTRTPDVVLLDQHLPDRRGSVALADLRSMGFAGPIVMVSGSPDVDELASSSGADDCIAKPLELDALLEVIERLTRKEPL